MAKIKNEDLIFVPAGTICVNCYKRISEGILRDGFGLSFFCKECYLENEKRIERDRELERTKGSS